ncbi:hypothetical protein BofuT4_uP013550.1 [Botrytis cinerea T4]|uniref:Uncharacterized protein n=1 Tax=Botryotinia fuckeliana (strain T4) TaxID=999810 RepID=G2XR78_BOTF4|nr:hypothetical protein BofuT4_uP013550.1 [Botrytis cinerea T4]
MGPNTDFQFLLFLESSLRGLVSFTRSDTPRFPVVAIGTQRDCTSRRPRCPRRM